MNDHQLYRLATEEYDVSFYFLYDWLREASWNFNEYRIPALTFWFIREGSRKLIVAGEEYLAEPGDLIVLPLGLAVTTAHTGGEQEPLRYLSMGIRAIIGGMNWNELFGIPIRLPLEAGGELTELVLLWKQLIHDEKAVRSLSTVSDDALFSARASVAALAWEARFKLWMSLMTKIAIPFMSAPEPALDKRVRDLCAYIRTHYERPFSASELARAACLSEGHMRATFRQAMGITPHQYTIQVRMEKAKELLALTDLPLAEIAERVGLEDVSYFINGFRKREGMTPAVYRKRTFPWI
ncbi:AraC family transcriptional regulator [Paenibacillus sacheonensis]|uniref:Helix-turn-helix domain-containing protein n=1 Tax=Paenibacillus sacheonensis TaxID=742054 RepID=A0A7X4YUH9_9BACL|nr:AraC family transcriptional regulator [Paenibacillus sacheonensis]MBM7568170.1 AraC-like DNA-binding protein [Paenibacillus sacheonensis]NBC71829.1 helix-turn-helix domain-containing protein [Paenibacillus sacheonensis]